MSTSAPAPASPPETAPAVEQEHRISIGQIARDRARSMREGDLGSLPIVIGIIVIAIYFQSRNSNFLTAANFVNLIAQMAAVMIIGTGIVFVLLLGEIDLSVGYVSGMGGVIAALLLEPGKSIPTSVAVALALGTGVAIGLIQGWFVAKVGVPSFVVTLAGLLGWNGVVLLIIGSSGTIVIQNSFINGIANSYMPSWLAWVVAVASVVAYAWQHLANFYRRRRAKLPTDPYLFLIGRIVVLAAAAIAVVVIADSDRGLPYVSLIMLGSYVVWTFVADRTRFGRHIYGVGGNAEAARRAGIDVRHIRVTAFTLCSAFGALGGVFLASTTGGVQLDLGSGNILLFAVAAAVIGGTSLFGGRGRPRDAIIGALVITIIPNGIGLRPSLPPSYNSIITGAVLLIAAAVDALSRRRSAAR